MCVCVCVCDWGRRERESEETIRTIQDNVMAQAMHECTYQFSL